MGRNIDVTFDLVGFVKTMSTTLKATFASGKVCLVGMGHNETTVPLTIAIARYGLLISNITHSIFSF